MKVAIIGYGGSGKSTLAKKLGAFYEIPVLHLDQVHWLPNWIEREAADEQGLVEHFLDEHDGWVIDGNYSNLSKERRMKEADQIIFMDFNRVNCLFRVFKRYHMYRGRTREDMGEGCNEKIDLEFCRWIWHDGRTKKKKAGYQKVQQNYGEKVVTVKNQRQLDTLLGLFGDGSFLEKNRPQTRKPAREEEQDEA